MRVAICLGCKLLQDLGAIRQDEHYVIWGRRGCFAGPVSPRGRRFVIKANSTTMITGSGPTVSKRVPAHAPHADLCFWACSNSLTCQIFPYPRGPNWLRALRSLSHQLEDLLLEEYLENSGDSPELSILRHSAARLYGSVTSPEMVKAICTYVGTNGT